MVNRRHLIFIAAALLFSFLACQKDIPTTPENQNEISFLMTLYDIPGVSISVIKDNKIDYLEVHGIKDGSSQEPVTEQTLFQAASISKSVSTMTALKLVQDGKWKFKSSVRQSVD